eukprot:6696268-Prymnesium_polylepis.1
MDRGREERAAHAHQVRKVRRRVHARTAGRAVARPPRQRTVHGRGLGATGPAPGAFGVRTCGKRHAALEAEVRAVHSNPTK